MGQVKLSVSSKPLAPSFRRSLPEARKLGVNAVEIEATGELTPQQLTQTGRHEILHLLRSQELTISDLVCPLRRGLDIMEDLQPRLDHLRQCMKLAYDLGPRLLIIQPGQVPEKPDDPRALLMREALDDLGKHGDRIGVRVALDCGVDNPDTLNRYLDSFDTGSLAINFNPANLLMNGFDPYEAVKILHRRLVHVHAQDARRISPNRMATVPLGHGDIDWMQMLASFEEVGYRGYLTILGDNHTQIVAGTSFLRRIYPNP
jgi:L-ribulose-5-phosphate 3-epimerase